MGMIAWLTRKRVDAEVEKANLLKRIEELEAERTTLLRRIETITRNLVDNYNPTTVVEATGQSLVELLKESNAANRGVLDDVNKFNRDLQSRLDAAREKIDTLHGFLVIAGKKIGFFEGVLKGGTALSLTGDDVRPLINAYERYETALIKRDASGQSRL